MSGSHKSSAMRLMVIVLSSVLGLGVLAAPSNAYVNQTYSTTNFNLAGSATEASGEITLTPDENNKAGGIFSKSRISVSDTFTITAELNLGSRDVGGADGIAFVMQPNTSASLSSGGGIGYNGISNAFAVEFDTYNNGGDESFVDDHAGLMKSSTTDHSDWTGNNSSIRDLGDIEDGGWRDFRISWTPKALVDDSICSAANGLVVVDFDINNDGDFSDTVNTVSERLYNDCIDLEAYFAAYGNSTYYGFTAATGGSRNLQKIKGFTGEVTLRGNTPPTISTIPDQTVLVNSGQKELTFTITDDLTSAAQWAYADTITSSNTTAVPTVSLVTPFPSSTGSAATFTLRFTPSTTQVGASTVTVTFQDGDGYEITTSFVVNVIRPASAVLAYRIDWNTNTGYGYMNPQYAYIGSTVVLDRNLYKKDGYTFAGWNTKADGSGTTYADGATFKIDSSDVILHAQWKLVQTKPTITWATPVAIQEGTLLSATQLNALASVPGTYTYSPATAALLPVGKHTLKVTFVPTDPKFETIETTVEIEVLAKAKMTWATPASIVEGTPLSGTQLNALGSVPGSYSYAPAAGATLPVGKNTLKVTFTPVDTRLSAVTAEVTIDVTAKPAVVVPPTPVEPAPTVITSKQKVYFAMSSYALDAKAKADLTKLAKKALAAGSTFKVTVVGFTQPTAKDPNFKSLANNRAKAAANFLRSLGVKGSYSITGVGQAPVNIASSRYAEVTVIVQSK